MPTIANQQMLLEFKQFGCTRDHRRLFSGMNYTIHTGDVVHITGTNGAGKTTLLRALTGLFTDYDGDIFWREKLIQQCRYDFLNNLLFIGHLPGINVTLTPRENLTFLVRLNGYADVEQIDNALAQVGLYGYEDMPGHQLSAGQHRRVALARLYLGNALVWILDEPFTALDHQAIETLEHLCQHHAQRGGCVILTSHQTPNIPERKCLRLTDYRSSHRQER